MKNLMKKTITLLQAIETYLAHVKLTKSRQTYINYGSRLRMLAREFFGQAETLDDVTFERLMKWVSLKAEQCSNGTLRTYIMQIKTFFSWCVRVGYLEQSPADHIGLPKTAIAPDEVRGIDRDDRRKLLEYAKVTSSRNYAILMFLASTGCRVSACTTLLQSQLDLDEHKARVVEKGSRRVWVYFDQATAEALRDWLRERPETDHDHVFVGQKPYEPLTARGISQMMTRLCKKAGCVQHWSPHSLRHAVGQDWSRNPNASVVDVQNKLNHQSPLTTQRVYFARTSKQLRRLSDEYHLIDRDDEDRPPLRIVE